MRNIIILGIPFLLAVGCEYGISVAPGVQIKAPAVEQQPIYVEYFKVGDTLPPESPNGGDTLVVRNARGLNKAIAYYEQGLKEYSEQQLDSIFAKYCIVK